MLQPIPRMAASPASEPAIYFLPRMALTPGSKLGPYEIQSSLGAGGMGEVYSARDTRLDRTVAVALGDPKPDIWILDLARGSRTRLTFDNGIHSMPSWSGDGKRVLYVTQVGMNDANGSSIRAKQSSGTGQEEIVLDGTNPSTGLFTFLWPQWTPDGKYLAYQKQNGPANATFWAQSTTGDQKPFLVLQPQSPQGRIVQTRLSPDGHWLAYTSTDSGREEVYVTTFPSASGR